MAPGNCFGFGFFARSERVAKAQSSLNSFGELARMRGMRFSQALHLFSLARKLLLGSSLWLAVFAAPFSWSQDENLKLDYMPPVDAEMAMELQPEARDIGGGIRFLELESGEGEKVKAGDRVEAIYTGTFLDGTVFNRKSGRFHTFKFEVGAEPREIIRGWDIAMPYMQNGGTYWVAIPSQFAYREKGRRGQVPPFTTVVFEIEILDVN